MSLTDADCRLAVQFINKCKDNHQLIVDTYHSLSTTPIAWPESDLYVGDWLTVCLKYNTTYRHTRLDSMIGDTTVCLFSILKPGTILHEHRGHKEYSSKIIRCHYCIESSNDCALIVDGKIHQWEPGQGFFFDDSLLHSAYNRGDTDRVALICDIPRHGASDIFSTPTMDKMYVDRLF